MTEKHLSLGTCILILAILTVMFDKYADAQSKIWNATRDTDAGSDVQLTFGQQRATVVTMHQTIVMDVNYTIQCKSSVYGYVLYSKINAHDVAQIHNVDMWYLQCSNKSTLQSGDAVSLNGTLNVTIEGLTVGKALLLFRYRQQKQPGYKIEDEKLIQIDVANLEAEQREFDMEEFHTNGAANNDNVTKFTNNPHPILVMLPVGKFDEIFRVIMTCVIVLGMVAMGCKTKMEIVKKDLRRPFSPIVALCCQYIGMPLIGYAIASIAPYKYPIMRFGIFCVGCCPGGGNSNFYSYMLGGDVSLSITMTTISSFASFGLFPLWVLTLGQVFLDSVSADITIPFLNVFLSIITVIAPLTVGLLLSYKFPKASKIIARAIIPILIVGVIAATVVFCITNSYIFEILSGVELVAGACLPHVGFLLGGLVAWITRHSWTRIKTIALETGLQNFGIAMMTFVYSIPPPDSNLAIVAAVGAGMMTGVLITPGTIIYIIQRKIRERYYKKVPTDDETKAPKSVEMEIVNGEKIGI